ncbi:MAG: N-glycosylase/DNA lyase [Pyrinomonadaceae bacterium]
MKNKQQLTIEVVRETYRERQEAIRSRLAEFAAIWQANDDSLLWQELVFCIFTANASARMGLRSVAAVKEHLLTATQDELAGILNGVHRFPNARAAYIATTREFLLTDCGLRLKERLDGFSDSLARRDWLAQTRQIKGLGYKEASHFLRNIGYRGYAILDKHILNSMAELGFITDSKPPSNRTRYLATEEVLKQFAAELKIDFDELDLVLWSIKTGEILK